MVKFRKDKNLTELLKLGFVEEEKEFVYRDDADYEIICINKESRIISFAFEQEEDDDFICENIIECKLGILFDLITANLVEKGN